MSLTSGYTLSFLTLSFALEKQPNNHVSEYPCSWVQVVFGQCAWTSEEHQDSGTEYINKLF
jgi:hypothetical protein